MVFAENVVQVAFLLFLLMFDFGTLFVCCYHGDLIREKVNQFFFQNLIKFFIIFFYSQSFELSQTIYSISWFDFTKEIKMGLNLMMLRTQKPLQIKLGDFFFMNLEVFRIIVNKCFSIFSILKGMK